MNLKKTILQIGTLSFCVSVVIFAVVGLSAPGIVNLSFIMFVIVTGFTTYYLVKRYPPQKEGDKKIEPTVEEEIISEHVISIDRTEVIKSESSESKEKKDSKKAAPETEKSNVKE